MPRFYVNIFSLLVAFVMMPALHAQDIKSLVRSGDVAFENGNYYGASVFYKRALRIKPDMPDVIYLMAESCRLDNDYAKSAKYYNKLVPAYVDKFPLAEFYLAQMLKSRADYLMAQHHFRGFLEYYTEPHEADYYSIRAAREIVACEIAQRMMFHPVDYGIVHADTSINSWYADFTLDGLRDSVSFFASIRPEGPESSNFFSRIYMIQNEQVKELPESINSPGTDVANPFWDSKNSRLYFTLSDSLPTRIFTIDYRDGVWVNRHELPPSVNYPGAVTTHPVVFHTDTASYVLYASDNPGGMGGFDIYYNRIYPDGSFGRPRNWGRREQGNSKYAYLIDTTSYFNTAGNEITPYYNVADSCLYFSSDWHYGMGEYDIFRMKALPGDTAAIENVGYPLNSPQNDVYFRLDRSLRRVSLTSNRDEALALKHQSCCNDIFYFDLPEVVVEKTEEEILQEEVTIMTEQAVELIPITLYFHNDRPDPGSWDTITDVNYETSFQLYLERENEYRKIFTAGLKGEAEWAAHDSIEDFFYTEVTGEFQKLRKFMLLMEELLERDQKIVMTIKGYTSPLNTPEYNLNLAMRRISSLENYVREYKSGLFLPYLESGLLSIDRVSFGETQVKKGISDDPNDRRNSVYNPLAAMERKIQVIAVQVMK